MRVIVTGAEGKVGSAAVDALLEAGHTVLRVDQQSPRYGTSDDERGAYVRANCRDAADMFAVIRDADCVVHGAAIPEPFKDVPHRVFVGNLEGTFNVIQAAVAHGVRRIVNISSDSVAGFTWSQGAVVPRYCPIDEAHPSTPRDPYGQSKWFGEQLLDAAVKGGELSAVSIRPTWVQTAGTYEKNVGPFVRDESLVTPVFWSYVDAVDLAELICLAVEAPTPGHEVVLAAQPDNMGSRDLHASVAAHFAGVELRPVDRVDASGISIEKARALFGWDPSRSWRDFLDEKGQAIGTTAGGSRGGSAASTP